MNEDENKLVMEKVLHERIQGPDTRKQLYKKIRDIIGKPIISFFTSFNYPVMITNNDADMLEGLLQECDMSEGFYLLLSSPGGDGLAA
ncbi:MAG: hypothetical protein FJW63_08740 [Actinobacteria bacterium]|nr:hypothetical protein [Actinomycetota bacterium]